jgi:hypothetical protein
MYTVFFASGNIAMEYATIWEAEALAKEIGGYYC